MGGKGSGGYRENALPRDKNPVLQAHDPANLDVAVNARVMAFGKDVMAFEPPDFSDPGSIEAAFYRYLDMCSEHGIRPMVTSIANCFGMRRQEFTGIAHCEPRYDHWRNDVLTPEGKRIIQKMYDFLNTAWESYIMEEKGNPVKWIFLGKNYFGMRDQTERVSIRVEEKPELPAPEEVVAKYAAMAGAAKPELVEAEVEEAD